MEMKLLIINNFLEEFIELYYWLFYIDFIERKNKLQENIYILDNIQIIIV